MIGLLFLEQKSVTLGKNATYWQ